MTFEQKIILDKFGKQATTDIKLNIRTKRISNYGKSAVTASGNLDKSIKYKLTDDGMVITGNEYIYYLVYGRRPGLNPPFQVIRDWIDDKGIIPDSGSTEEDKDSMAWAIVKSIGKKGTSIYQYYAGRDTGLISEVIDDAAIIELRNDLAATLKDQFFSQVQQNISSIPI